MTFGKTLHNVNILPWIWARNIPMESVCRGREGRSHVFLLHTVSTRAMKSALQPEDLPFPRESPARLPTSIFSWGYINHLFCLVVGVTSGVQVLKHTVYLLGLELVPGQCVCWNLDSLRISPCDALRHVFTQQEGPRQAPAPPSWIPSLQNHNK